MKWPCNATCHSKLLNLSQEESAQWHPFLSSSRPLLCLWGWGLLTWAASMRKRASASGPEPLRGAGAGATTCKGILVPANIIHRLSLGMKGVWAWHIISRWHTASEARHRLQERVTCTTGMPTWAQTPNKHKPLYSQTCPYRLSWVRLCQPSAALSYTGAARTAACRATPDATASIAVTTRSTSCWRAIVMLHLSTCTAIELLRPTENRGRCCCMDTAKRFRGSLNM